MVACNVRRLSVSYRMKLSTSQKILGAYRLLSVISNMNYNSPYSLLFLSYHRNRIFQYFLVNYEYRLSIDL